MPRRHALLDQMRDAHGDDAGLAAARARQHQKRPLGVQHRFALRGVQCIQVRFVHINSMFFKICSY